MHFSPTIGRSIIACLAPFLVEHLSWFGLLAQGAESVREIRFSQDILPILSDKCFQCHGPDAQARKGDLRLDQESAAKGQASSGLAIIDPGKSNTSELLVRIHSQDVDEVMPPPNWGVLSAKRKRTSRDVDPRRRCMGSSLVPRTHRGLGSSQPGSPPGRCVCGAEARRKRVETATRSLSLDTDPPPCTGLDRLTPTPSEMDAMLKDDASSWWEKAIDRFLASPAYGERMAWEWLDAARYADSNGYQEIESEPCGLGEIGLCEPSIGTCHGISLLNGSWRVICYRRARKKASWQQASAAIT